MPYTARELPAEDWGRLADLPVGQHHLSPESAAIVVVENRGTIIASAAALTVPHAEEFWIDETYRGNPVVVSLLLDEFFTMLRSQGIQQVFSVAPNAGIASLLESLGGMAVGTLYLVPVPPADTVQ